MNPYRLVELLMMMAGGVLVGALSQWWLAVLLVIPASGWALVDIRPGMRVVADSFEERKS